MMELLFENRARQDVKDATGRTCMLVEAEAGNGKGVKGSENEARAVDEKEMFQLAQGQGRPCSVLR